MASASDLAGAIANVQSDETAIAAGIAAVKAAIAGIATGVMTQADLDAAVQNLSDAHAQFTQNVTDLGTIAANP